MKKIILSAAMIAFGMTSVFAQNTAKKGVPPPNSSHLSSQHVRMKKNPKLTIDKVAAIKADRLDKIVGLKPKQKAHVIDIYKAEAQATDDRAALHKETVEKVRSVLDKGQIRKLDKYKKARLKAGQVR